MDALRGSELEKEGGGHQRRRLALRMGNLGEDKKNLGLDSCPLHKKNIKNPCFVELYYCAIGLKKRIILSKRDYYVVVNIFIIF